MSALLKPSEDSIHVAVMGVTGSGKSTFIKMATGLDVPIGHGLRSSTDEVNAYPMMHRGTKYILLDTPGFDDTVRSDTEVLRELALWLVNSYQNSVLLSGIIYMHRILDVRMGGSALRNLRMFKKLLGDDPIPRVTLVTTFWDSIPPSVGEARERELYDEDFWGYLIARGSRVSRSSGTHESALAILESFSSYKSGVVLNIQRELVDERRTLYETKAGAYLDEEIQVLRQRVESLEKSDDKRSFRQHRTKQAENSLQNDPDQNDPRSEAEQAGNRDDLNASWNPDYGSLWINEQPNTPPTWNSQIYVPLADGDFRLVELMAGEKTMPIEVSLIVKRLNDQVPFAALSYAVGHDQRQLKIKLRHQGRRYNMDIGENLHTALIHLRQEYEDVTLWIDALSINQNKPKERAQQIRRMGDIFSKAANVCIWLGPAEQPPESRITYDLELSYSNDVAMKLAKELLDLNRLDAILQNTERRAELFCLTKLLAGSWFTRRWCVQEVLMARQASVHCGDHRMPWSDFVDMAQLLSTRWPDIQSSIDANTQHKIGNTHLIGALALINTSATILRQTSAGDLLERLMTLESLLTVLAMFEVTVSLDAVYSIYNLARDLADSNDIEIDYDLQPRELFSKVTEFIVRRSGSLNIICYPWAPLVPLPSWIPTTARQQFKRRRNGFQYDRQYGCVLVDKPGTEQRYKACGVMSKSDNVTFMGGVKPLIQAKGLFIGKISEFGGQSLNGTIPSDWLRICGWIDVHAQRAPPSFWKTVVADQGTSERRAPKWYKRACETAVRDSNSEHIDTALLYDNANSTHVKEYLQKVREVIWSRALAKVTLSRDLPEDNNTAVCLCPKDAREGDEVCILYGCNVPVILQRQADGLKLVGECFLHSFMDGEALLSRPPFESRSFNLI